MKKLIATLVLIMFLVGCSNETNSDKSVSENKESDPETTDVTVENNSSESLTNSQEKQNNDVKESSSLPESDDQEQKDSQKESESNTKNVNKEKDNKEKYIEKLNAIEKEAIEIRKSDEDTTLGMIKSEEEILSKWDQVLNEIYQVLERQLTKSEMEQLRVEQRKWIEFRDKIAKEAAKNYEGGTMESLEYIASKAGTTKERSYELVESYMK